MVQMDPDALEAGRDLAHPPPGEEVIISGCSGAFPDCDSVTEFANKLFNKEDCISGDGRRWILDHPEIPQRTGKLNNISKFDAGYFGIHYKQAQAMDPMCRMVLEKAAEAVFDAGYNPQYFFGKRVGVFVGACFSETEKTWFYEKLQVNGFGVTGCARTMLANRISYWLGVKGPSYTIDTACSSSLYAFEHAYRAIREGLCDAAVVAGTNLCLHPYVSLQFSRLGVLSKDGKCKSFDESANGYCRSEAISAVLLQKRKDARRIYATVVHAKTNCDGYKEEGITFPSGPLQQSLLEEFYEECQVKPWDLAWVEAHGTGTKVGDPEEVKAIENVFCVNRKEPLKIGSLKSNTGHTEPASGLLSITKVIIAMESGYIPPNINYSEPRKDIESLHNGKIVVVTEKTPWAGGLVGVNSFGFGGANCHVLLKWNEKEKINKGLPSDDLPRLVYISGRTHDAIDNILSNMEGNTVDVELIKLFHTIFKDEVPGHLYRGYTILSKSGKLARAIKECPTLKQPFWYVFPGLGVSWKNSHEYLKKLPMFSQTFMECFQILKKQNVDLLSLTKNNTFSTFNTMLLNCVYQIIFVKMLKDLGFEPDRIIGTSVGEIVCAYADGSLSLEQAVLTSYFVSKAISQLDSQNGITVLIALPYSTVKSLSSSGINFVYKGENTTIISGSEPEVNLVMQAAEKSKSAQIKILLRVALHSNLISSIKSTLLQQLQKVIVKNRISSPKWLSTSSTDKNGLTNFCVSAEYFCNNLLNPIDLEEWFNTVERYSAVIEIASEPNFGVLMNRNTIRKKLSFVQILSANQNAGEVLFLESLGKIANLGANLDLALLYPKVEFPVSRSTPMISPLIKWDHETDWYVTSYKTQDRITTGERFITLSLKDEEQEYISGHVIDGRNLFPATGYLFLVWESVALMNAQLQGEVSVVFENVRFNRATNMPKDGGTVDFTVTIQRSSGFFEVMESGATIVTGKIYIPEDIEKESSNYNRDSTSTMDDSIFVLKSKDIYKELRLRGYNYKGLFKSVLCSNLEGSHGFIKWHNNYVAFMDNMLQMQILNTDSRALFVPTGLSRVVIDVKKHAKIVGELDEENKVLPVYNNKYVKMIKSGGIEIRGLNASAISRRKPLGEPVLENYQFLPYYPNQPMDIDSTTRLFVHIVLENSPTISVKVFEMGDLKTYEMYLAHSIINGLAALPLIQPDVTIYNAISDKVGDDRPAELSTEEKKMPNEQSALIAVGCDLLDPQNDQNLQACIGAVKETGFIISRDQVASEVTTNNLIKYSTVFIENTYYTLLRKVKSGAKKLTAIRVDNKDLSWIKPLQEALKSEEYKKVIVYSENEKMSGVVGLVNCILKEGQMDKARCFFILDPNARPFSLEDSFYSKQIEKDLAVNIYKNGEWGSFRHLLLDSMVEIDTHHAYISFLTKGDLSSLTWAEGQLSKQMKTNPDLDVIHVYYSALNFRDVMTATGKLANEVVQPDRLLQDSVQGLEFSGRNSNGKRIMGITGSKGIASVINPKLSLTWEVPDDWTMEEAATVPCVYATIVYAFCLAGHPKKGDTILIHAGTGGIGQAAIHYCLFYGCHVFTTVGTPEKREFIKKTFPQLTDNQIGNSRDTSFEQLIMRETDGRGVDFVINSLAEEKLLASVRCLARGGRFLELGKFDMANDNPLGMEFLLKEASFHGIMLNVCFNVQDKWKTLLFNLVQDAVKVGAIRPFSRQVFGKDEVENALRHMAAGKHMGKVLIKIRDEEPDLVKIPKPVIIKAKPRFYCDENKTYVILGGLGGFGLELTDWLILRGARKVLLSSRSGVKEGYQAIRINVWESYEVKVEVFTGDVTTEEGVTNLLKKANEMGPVGGIYNLAVVLKDALFDNQTEEDFKISLGPKAVATELLDRISRKMCPELDQFVIFSSVSCGRGNAGQTNYGMSNSIMERICEQRVEDGYPGLAIQWGAVGDVGLVANMQEENTMIVIGGTLPQKIDSCLSVMDRFLNDKHPVVASMVVAEKKAGSGGAGNMIDAVLNIIGLRDLKSISMHSTLAELGMDSMMAVEIKQTLEREFEVFLTPQDIRGMTFAKLQDIANAKNQGGDKNAGAKTETGPEGLQALIRFVADEATASIPVMKFDSLNTSEETNNYSNRVFFMPGIEGFAAVFQSLCTNIKYECYCVQYDFLTIQNSIVEVAQVVAQRMESYIDKNHIVRVVAYSFGGIVSLEVITILEKLGYKTALCIIDGSPDLMRHLVRSNLDITSEVLCQIGVLLGFVDLLWPQDKTKLEPALLQSKDWESRMDVVIKATEKNLNFNDAYKKTFITAIYKRLMAVSSYQKEQDNSLNAPLALIRPATNMMVDYEEDYGLSKYFKKEVDVHVVEGNHITILENIKTAEIINGFLSGIVDQ